MIKNINLNIFDNKSFYFVHSFKAIPSNKDNLLGFYYLVNKVAALVGKDNVFGTQFHPEKSGKAGLELIKKFVNLNLMNKTSTYANKNLDFKKFVYLGISADLFHHGHINIITKQKNLGGVIGLLTDKAISEEKFLCLTGNKDIKF